MIDWDKPIETLEGWPAKVISTDYKSRFSKLYVAQIERPGAGRDPIMSYIAWFKQDGTPWETTYQIRNVPVKREGWVRVWNSNGFPCVFSDVVFTEKASAEAACKKLGGVPACVVWEE